MKPNPWHPTAEQLRAFVEGRLSEEELAAIQEHLDGCAGCQAVLTAPAAEDPFIARLRLAAALEGTAIERAPHPEESTPTFRFATENPPSSPDDLSVLWEGTVDLQGAGAVPGYPRGPAPSVPGYEILGELGRGGMGVVYKARHLALNRVVALKVLLAGSHASAEDQLRFRTEAEAVAQLRHPGIVQVYDYGSPDGVPYLALEYCDGGSLAVRMRGQPQPPREAARLVEAVARGVQAAHEHGIIHRDLKPGNILLQGVRSQGAGVSKDKDRDPSALTPDSCPLTPVPKIADFGLAKWLANDRGLTQSGTTMGTPSYIAPEQARGQGDKVGVRTDVYALGTILYELLTGRAPFHGDLPAATLMQVLAKEAVPVRRLQPGVPRDLETICLKCLEKEPSRRYASAAALADDLGRFLQGEPIQARPTGTAELVWRWARRRPGVAALLALLILTALTGFGMVLRQWYETEKARQVAADLARNEQRARQDADAGRRDAERERHRAETLSASLGLDQGIQLCREGRMGPGLLWMARALELLPEGEEDLDYALRANLTAWRGQFCRSRQGDRQWTAVTAAAFSPDGKTILTGNWGNVKGQPGPAQACLWDVADWGSDRRRATLELPGPILSVAFHPDGKTAAIGHWVLAPGGRLLGGAVRLFDLATGKPRGEPLPHVGRVFCVAFSRDGKRLAVGGLREPGDPPRVEGGEVRLWDTATGKPQGEALTVQGLLVRTVAWSPDDHFLALGGGLPGAEGKSAIGGAAVLYDLERRTALPPILHSESVNAVAFHPGGEVLVTASDHNVRLWDVKTRERLPRMFPHPHPVNALVFSPDGRVLITGSGDFLPNTKQRAGPGEARLWDWHTGQPLSQPLVHTGDGNCNKVHAVALSPDGRSLVTASEDGHAWLWSIHGALPSLSPLATLTIGSPARVAFSPDGRTLVLTDSAAERQPDLPHILILFDALTGDPTGVRLSHPTAVRWEFSPDSSRVLTVSDPRSREHVLRLWDVKTGKAVAVPDELARGVRWGGFTPDGKRLATAVGRKLRLWDVVTFEPDAGFDLQGGAAREIDWVTFAPDGASAWLGAGEELYRLELPEGRWALVPLPQPGDTPMSASFTVDGRIVVVTFGPGGQSNKLCRYDAEGTLLQTPHFQPGFKVLRPHPDGRRFLLTVQDGFGLPYLNRLWDADTGQVVGPAPPLAEVLNVVDFHPSGRFLALGGFAEHARLWSLAGKRVGPALPHPGVVQDVRFTSDGRRLATSGQTDQTVRLWRVPAPVEGRPGQVRLLVELLTGQELDEGGGTHDLSAAELDQRRQTLDAESAGWPP
jgi:serine/threonine protein kinase/WD40 repeat protein